HDLWGVLRFDARSRRRSGAVQRNRCVLPPRRSAGQPRDLGGRRLPDCVVRVLAGLLHTRAGRRTGPHGQGGHRAARRACPSVGCPVHLSRRREPGDVAVLDRRGARARDVGNRRPEDCLRRTGGRWAGRAAAASAGHAPRARARLAISERTVIVAQQYGRDVEPAKGKLGVMLVGLGAVSTTFIAGVENIRRGTALPIGSLSQMGTIRLGKRTEKRAPKIKEFVPLARLEDLVFEAWDPIPDDAYSAAKKAGVLEAPHPEPTADFLWAIT